MYLLAVLCPPFAVLCCGKPFQAVFVNLPLTLLFYFPGLIHACCLIGNLNKAQAGVVNSINIVNTANAAGYGRRVR
jgi:uncharacterized membrane protein YqaE (UPF0057 family)